MAFGLSLQNRLSSCTGAEVRMMPDGTFNLRLVELSLHKKLIRIDSKTEQAGDLNQIAGAAGNKPLALTLTGKGILIKKTPRLENITGHGLQHLFPDLKMADFYVQHFSSGESSFVSIIRKEITDHIIAAFADQGTGVLILSLGPFAMEQVIPQVNIYDGNLNFDGHNIQLDAEKNWLEYRYVLGSGSAFELKIEMEVLPEQYLLAYAAAFQLILQDQLDLVEVPSALIRENRSELSAGIQFKYKGTMVLLGFFVLLFANFLVFSFYNSSNRELAGKAGQRSDLSSNRQKLETAVKQKELTVKKLGWNKGLRYAYLCDQLGQSLPGAVTLDELSFNQQETGRLYIKGETSSIYAINDWIYALKQKNWVKAVELEKYAADDQKQRQVFTIVLNY